MKNRHLILGLAGFAAIAIAGPAIGGSGGPSAQTSASAKKTAKKALKLAKKNKKAIKNVELTPGPKGDQGDQGAQGDPATKLFASVLSGGDLDYGKGATAAERTGTGTYKVTFNRSLTNCVAAGVAGGQGGFFIDNVVTVHLPPGNSEDADQLVAYVVRTSTDAIQDSPVLITVFC